MKELDQAVLDTVFSVCQVEGPHRVVCDCVPAEWVVELLRRLPPHWSLLACADPAKEEEIWAAVEASDIPAEKLIPLTVCTMLDWSEQAGWTEDFLPEMQVWMLASGPGRPPQPLIREFLPMVSHDQAVFLGPVELSKPDGTWTTGDTLAAQVVLR